MRNLRRLFALTLLLAAAAARAQSPALPSGEYQADVPLGPALLAGRYACYLADEEAGFLKVSTSSAGVLTGSITLLGRAQDFTGSLLSQPTGLRVLLRGKVREGAVVVRVTLVGGQLLGTASIRGKKAPIRIDLAGVAPMRARCRLALVVSQKGTVTGTGTWKVGQVDVPVLAFGLAARGKVSLFIKQGRRTLFRITRGTVEEVGFTAEKWVAQSFGALTRGINQRFGPVAP